MRRNLDPKLQQIIDGATDSDVQNMPFPEFNFMARGPRTREWSFGPSPVEPVRKPMLLTESLSSRDAYSYETPNEPPTTQSTTTRLSLAPRGSYNQQEHVRGYLNTDYDPVFTQNLDQKFTANPRIPIRNNVLVQNSPSQLSTLPFSRGPAPTASLGKASHFHERRSSRPNLFQPQNQEVTPPFVLNSDVYSPITQLSSPPEVSNSSPTARVSLRRLPSRAPPPSRHPREAHDLGETSSSSETPRRLGAVMSNTLFKSSPQALALGHAPPMAHGIQLISPHELPDRFRQIFPYELFNAAQSRCLAPIYRGNDNVVVSAPTGCGKTAMLELAICKLVEGHSSGEFKIVYQAPTKALCSERMRDWQRKFSHLNLPCAELTGDTSQFEMSRVRNASIIVTTPEKWDSITRKWHDHVKLLQMVKLFLIDEVHMLKDARGATLEAVVSRMKSSGANVRFVALSATVPNSEDIALWLGKDPSSNHLPAHRETFGEDFRPVKLQKHVYGFEGQMNDFAFEKFLDGKLSGLIQKHSCKKPIMVFCFTRKSCETTATILAEWWSRQRVVDRAWPSPTRRTEVSCKELQDLLGSGVAFHHAGLDPHDRSAIESAFLKGDINVICCTSTLAVGINLPCHLVVLKGTVGFQDGRLGEYSDLEVMQMLGRAGRPQFDESAVAIIITRSDKVDRYKRMASGQDILESTLHLNLIEHLNSEIGLGTVHSMGTAGRWLSGTFLSVRMSQNPGYYKFEGIDSSRNAKERLQLVCERDVKLLQDYQLVTDDERFMCTEYGQAMSRYMVQFETMKLLLSLQSQAKPEQILQLLCQASEFKDLRMKPNERQPLREFNKSPLIKFPIQENISATPHKISLVIQVQLGGIDLPTDKEFLAIKRQFHVEKGVILERIQRLVRCIVDCKSVDCDAVSVRNALDLARSLSAEYWEHSNLQLRQIPQIGPAASRKLVTNNINSVEELVNLDTGSIERIMSRNPPFGRKVLDSLLGFPRLTIRAEMTGKATSRPGENPKVKVNVQLGFLNAKTPVWKGKKPSLTFMAEVSDGTLVHFWRGNVQKLDKTHELRFIVELSNPDEEIRCHIACDEIVGTSRSSLLKPDVPASAFPAKTRSQTILKFQPARLAGNDDIGDEFGGDDFEDDDLLEAVKRVDVPISEHGGSDVSDDFPDIDDLEDAHKAAATLDELVEPVQMANGKWTCNHQCSGGQALKNGQLCKHRCCHEGLDKPRKPKGKPSTVKAERPNFINQTMGGKQPNKIFKGRLKLKCSKYNHEDDPEIEVIDLADELPPEPHANLATPRAKASKDGKPVRLPKQDPGFSYASGQQPEVPFLKKAKLDNECYSSDSVDSGGGLALHSGWLDEGIIDSSNAAHKDAFDISARGGFSESPGAAVADFYDVEDPSTPAPKASSSFENGVFDFSAFSDQPIEEDMSPGHLKKDLFKRQRSLTPELTHIKCRRVTKDNPSMEEPELVGEGAPQRSTPAWVDEFDSALIDDLRGIVDFVD